VTLIENWGDAAAGSAVGFVFGSAAVRHVGYEATIHVFYAVALLLAFALLALITRETLYEIRSEK